MATAERQLHADLDTEIAAGIRVNPDAAGRCLAAFRDLAPACPAVWTECLSNLAVKRWPAPRPRADRVTRDALRPMKGRWFAGSSVSMGPDGGLVTSARICEVLITSPPRWNLRSRSAETNRSPMRSISRKLVSEWYLQRSGGHGRSLHGQRLRSRHLLQQRDLSAQDCDWRYLRRYEHRLRVGCIMRNEHADVPRVRQLEENVRGRFQLSRGPFRPGGGATLGNSKPKTRSRRHRARVSPASWLPHDRCRIVVEQPCKLAPMTKAELSQDAAQVVAHGRLLRPSS